MLLPPTPSIPNYNSFDFFDPKFDHSSYSKIYAKYHIFCCVFINKSSSKNDLNLTMFAQIFLNKTSGQTWGKKCQTNYNLEWS
jgi:hypothetical protein